MKTRRMKRLLLIGIGLVCIIAYVARAASVIQADAAKKEVFQIGESFRVGDCMITVTKAEVSTIGELLAPYAEELEDNIEYIYQYKVREEAENRAYILYLDIMALSDGAGIILSDMRFHSEWWFCNTSPFLDSVLQETGFLLSSPVGETKTYVIYFDVIKDYLGDNWKDIDKDDKMLTFTNDLERLYSVNLGKLSTNT